MLQPSDLLKKIIECVPEISKKEWEAQTCIIEMKNAQYRNWKQTEWVGFYLEYITEKTNIPGVAQFKMFVGNTSFNGCAGKNIIDYKTSSENADILLNDQEAVQRVVRKYGELGYIILKGTVVFENDNELDLWRQNIAGKSAYVKKGILEGRRHRKLKSIFKPTNIMYLSVNKNNIKRLKDFKQGKNSDGNNRAIKYMIAMKDLPCFLKATLIIN